MDFVLNKHKQKAMESTGIEPVTSCMLSMRATNCANSPLFSNVSVDWRGDRISSTQTCICFSSSWVPFSLILNKCVWRCSGTLLHVGYQWFEYATPHLDSCSDSVSDDWPGVRISSTQSHLYEMWSLVRFPHLKYFQRSSPILLQQSLSHRYPISIPFR